MRELMFPFIVKTFQVCCLWEVKSSVFCIALLNQKFKANGCSQNAEYDAENPSIMTRCEHHFHLSCILEWMERSGACPICDQVSCFCLANMCSDFYFTLLVPRYSQVCGSSQDSFLFLQSTIMPTSMWPKLSPIVAMAPLRSKGFVKHFSFEMRTITLK